MAHHNKLGKDGELIAFMFLQKEGFHILKTNWCYQKSEVEIIAQKDGFLVFIEVTTRDSKNFGKAKEAIDKKQIMLYKDASDGYLEQYPSDSKISFDVIGIIIRKDETQIEYFPDAF